MRFWVPATFLASCLWTIAQGENLKVDLQPCILAKDEPIKDDAATTEAYMMSQFYKGFWSASQLLQVVGSSDTLDLTHTDEWAKCNAVYVGIVPTDAQKIALQNFSSKFKVRLVFFESSGSADDTEVQERMGFAQWWAEPLLSAPYIKITDDGAKDARVVASSMTTDPRTLNIYTRPVHQTATLDGAATTSIVANYVDEDETALLSALGLPSVAAMTYVHEDGLEELHIFFSMAWFDLGSWGWAHYVVEWATRGIFMGERRFYLAGMVDDLFLGTGVWEYDGDTNEGAEVRVSGEDMQTFLESEEAINKQYSSSIKTEFPFNGLGILEKVDSAHVLDIADADIALLPKGDKVQGEGITPQLPTDWLATAVRGMKREYRRGLWDTDDLLMWVLSNKDKFWWHSHTLSHLARDNLGVSDCNIEDTGNSKIAVITRLFRSDSYGWRSMTTPGITGLFNKYCLSSAVDNFITCAPGDNTYDGVQTTVSLISDESEFHSIYTTEADSEYAGFQIVPRYATYVYFNCVTGDCLVNENEWIRRVVCECSELDPSLDKGTCSRCEDDIESLGSVDNIFQTEAEVTTRQMMSGRRDKYMFHQANVIPTELPTGTKSLLEYWYEQVMLTLSSYIAFPVTSKKFDDLCSEFTLHETLDASGALITATIDGDTGDIFSFELSADDSSDVGFIPLTVPTESSVAATGLLVGSEVNYGSDTTYYVTKDAEYVPKAATRPRARDLPSSSRRSLQEIAESSPTSSPTSSPVTDSSSSTSSVEKVLLGTTKPIDPTVDPIPFSEPIDPALEVPTGTLTPIDSVPNVSRSVGPTVAPTPAP